MAGIFLAISLGAGASAGGTECFGTDAMAGRSMGLDAVRPSMAAAPRRNDVFTPRPVQHKAGECAVLDDWDVRTQVAGR
jgi:hypothetical protein